MTQIILGAPMDGWLCPLDEVPDAVFAGRMLGDGTALDPLGEVLCAPADGTVASIHEARHAITLRLAGGVEILLHFGLDTVRLRGEGFLPLVAEGAIVRAGDPLLRVSASALAARVKSLITPIVITETAGHAITLRAEPGLVSRGDPILTLTMAEPAAPQAGEGTEAFSPAVAVDVRIPLAHGLHARPCAKLAGLARDFDAEIRLAAASRTARLRSPSAVLALGLRHGDRVTVQASGLQAEPAAEAIAAAIAGGMGEAAPFPAETRPVAAQASSTPVEDAPPAGSSLSGVCASKGLAAGNAWLFTRPEPEIAETAADPSAERARFETARAQLASTLASRMHGGPDAGDAILDAHLALLEDEDLVAATHAGIAAGASAGHAWRQVMQAQAAILRASPDSRFAERADDMLDLELQLQWRIAGQEMPAMAPPQGAVLIADDLMPSQAAALDPQQIAGIATARGGPTSHVAIIAAGKGIPALVALGPRLLAIAPETTLVLDAGAGQLEVAPDKSRLAEALSEIARRTARKTVARAASALEGRTADGTRIEVFANLGKRGEAAPALELGAEGCGLLRTEFLFLDRADAPDEDEQAAEYTAISQALEGKPLIVRLLDIGGDKPAPYLPIGPEENPALGLRGIRVGLAHPDMLSAQLRAILRAGASGDLRVMAPMIARVEELRTVRAALSAEAAALGLATRLPLGVMVETPAAAVMAGNLAAECDFLSIGTNDLTQYTLATDRGNPVVAANLDGMDPAVLRMIDLCCRGAAEHGKWTGVCGGLASDPLAVPILIGLGVTELSAAPAMVAEVKAMVRAVTLARCRELASAALAASTTAEVRALARALVKETGL